MAKGGVRRWPHPTTWLHLEDGSHLDRPGVSRRTPGGVGDRFVEVLGLDHVEADQLVSAVHERTGGGFRRAVADPDRLRRLRGMDGVARLEHPLAVYFGE